MALFNRLAQLFPPGLAATKNGNGGQALAVIEAPSEAKDAQPPIIWPRADFIPIDSSGNTIDVTPDVLNWYASAWLPYACMRYRATKLVEAPLWIAQEKDGEEEWLGGDHELADLLERPNPDMEMADLLELTSLYLDSTGATIWVKNRDRGKRVGSLYPFSAQEFRVESFGGRLFGRYKVTTSSGEKIYGPEDIVHFRNVSPSDPHGAVAPLHAALARLGIDRTLVASIVAGLKNAVVPGITITFPVEAGLTPEQGEEYAASIGPKYERAKNHGKSFVVGGGATTTKNKLGFEGLNSGELGKEVEAAVCACFSLPPVVISAFVGLVNSSDRHNLETSVLLAYDNATIPTWSRMEKAMTRSILREVDTNPLRFIRFDKSKIKALQVDRVSQADIVQKAGKALRVNDARSLLGIELLDDERGEEMLGASASAPAVEPLPAKSTRIRIQTKDASDDQLRWALFDAVTSAQAFGWELVVAQQLEADKAAVLGIINAEGKAGAAPDERKDPPPPPIGPADAGTLRRIIKAITEHMDLEAAVRWRDAIEPLISDTARRAVERVAAELSVSFNLLQPGLIDYTEREAAWLVTRVTDTTKQEIRAALSAGLLEGESIPDLAKRVEGSGTFARTRAELIARTETTRVTNGGQRESLSAYQAGSGDTITKRWLATQDDRTRDAHRAMDGETHGINEEFSNGLQAPGEPNCRCTLVYSLEAA